MDNRKVIYYQDELNDEFSTAVIEAKKIDGDYVYDRKGPVRAFTRFFWYRIVATPIAFLYAKLSLHQRSVGREKLKPFRKQGIYLYGNHTQAIGDPFTPNVFCFPKRVSFIVHANNVSMPYLGRINPSLGAIPLPDTREAYRNFQDCIAGRSEKHHAVVIYPLLRLSRQGRNAGVLLCQHLPEARQQAQTAHDHLHRRAFLPRYGAAPQAAPQKAARRGV